MGPWLDRWIKVDSDCWGDLLFQAEVKSSSAYGTNGKTLSIETGGDELVVRKRAAWRKEWDETARCLKYPATGKVLVRDYPDPDRGFWSASSGAAPVFGGPLLLILTGGSSLALPETIYSASNDRNMA